MCGLLGTLNVRIDLDTARPLMASRGPDCVVAEQIDNVALCHARLAVVGADLPDTRQPMHLGGITAIYNGYISNYVELNHRLNVPNNAAESQAVIHSYARGGIAGLAQLTGQFAAAIVDTDRRVLVLARDPMGICPLYYARLGPAQLVFASQASWLLQPGLLDAALPEWRISERARAQWESVAYTLPDETLIAGIHEVPAGTALELSLQDGKLIARHDLATYDTQPAKTANADSIRDAIHDSVRRNLLGDTEPWVLLSGGIDSCIVLHCAVAARIPSRVITLNYPDGENADEVTLALDIARHYGFTPHVVDFPKERAQPSAELFRRRVDWPLDGGSLLPKVCLADEIHARAGRIVLGGTGADELFGGYRRHAARAELLAQGVPDEAAEKAFYRQWIANEHADESVWQRFCAAQARGTFADPAFVYDLLEMQQQHNPRIDSCFANVGVEYRPVLQDAQIVRLAASLPLCDKTAPGDRKFLLRQAFAREIPKRFVEAPKRPLRFGELGPTPGWRQKIFAAWLQARMDHLAS